MWVGGGRYGGRKYTTLFSTPSIEFHTLTVHYDIRASDALSLSWPLCSNTYPTCWEERYQVSNHKVLLHNKMQLISSAPQKSVSFHQTSRLLFSIIPTKTQSTWPKYTKGPRYRQHVTICKAQMLHVQNKGKLTVYTTLSHVNMT